MSLFFVTCTANTTQPNAGNNSTRTFYGNSTNKTFSEASYREYAYNTNAANTRYDILHGIPPPEPETLKNTKINLLLRKTLKQGF